MRLPLRWHRRSCVDSSSCKQICWQAALSRCCHVSVALIAARILTPGVKSAHVTCLHLFSPQHPDIIWAEGLTHWLAIIHIQLCTVESKLCWLKKKMHSSYHVHKHIVLKVEFFFKAFNLSCLAEDLLFQGILEIQSLGRSPGLSSGPDLLLCLRVFVVVLQLAVKFRLMLTRWALSKHLAEIKGLALHSGDFAGSLTQKSADNYSKLSCFFNILRTKCCKELWELNHRACLFETFVSSRCEQCEQY